MIAQLISKVLFEMAKEIKTVLCLFGLLLCANAFALPFEGLYRLDIIHYNDFHARFEETSVAAPTCRYNNNSCLGGFSRLFHEIEVLRKEKPDSILLNAGDSFQGTYWYTLLKWKIVQKFMNLLPHDAHAIGNHEFDDGPQGLAPYLSALNAPVLAANMDSTNEPVLQGLYRPSTVVERNGRRIGIIGLITVDTKVLSSAGNVTFTDPGEATRREAQALTDQGVDIIILLSHCGLEIDKELASNYGENIDIIIGGHSHSLLWNGTAPSGEVVAGPYPIFIQSTNDEKHKVLIVQTSAFTKYMGNLTVSFNYRGEYVNFDGGPIYLNRSIPEDKNITAKLQPYMKMVQEAEEVTLGYTKSTMNYEDCVYGECALGDLIVDAFNDKAKEEYVSDYEYVSLVQRGDIKTSILEGNITKGEIFELLPYNDRLETFELQGKYLRQALERSVVDAWAYTPFKGPWVLQVSGLRVVYNISRPEGSRIKSAMVGDKQTMADLDDDKYYQVTVPTYLSSGGDGFTMFQNYKRNVLTVGRDQDVVEAYITRHSPISPTTDERIRILS